MPNREPENAILSCQEAADLLPWFLNGSLEATERVAVDVHLRDCGSCRAELAETAAAWDLFGEHVPSLALAQYANGLEPEEVDRRVIEEHLAHCASCREELALATPDDEAPRRRSHVNPRRWNPRRRSTRRRWVLAASILLTLSAGAWLRTSRDGAPPSAAPVQTTEQTTADNGSSLFSSSFDEADLTSQWSQVVGGEGKLKTKT